MVTNHLRNRNLIVDLDAQVLVTGSSGFIGTRVVETLLSYGFRKIRCLVRATSNRTDLLRIIGRFPAAAVEVVEGNLTSRQDCARASRDVRIVFHLAAGIEKSFPGCVLNSVVTTRNLLDSLCQTNDITRFVNISSLSVYSNFGLKRNALLDETCELEKEHVSRNEPYVFGKLKQDEIVIEYADRYKIPYVILRPGAVYGPGKAGITARVGIDTFGTFLHLGGPNRIPFTHVDNCAEAIVLAGITRGVDGHIFNIVDDDIPTSKEFLKKYKKNVGPLNSLYIPYQVFYLLCVLWERYSEWSGGQLPPAFNRRKCAAYWKGNLYSNRKLKELLGWRPRISFSEGSLSYFDYLKTLRRSSC